MSQWNKYQKKKNLFYSIIIEYLKRNFYNKISQSKLKLFFFFFKIIIKLLLVLFKYTKKVNKILLEKNNVIRNKFYKKCNRKRKRIFLFYYQMNRNEHRKRSQITHISICWCKKKRLYLKYIRNTYLYQINRKTLFFFFAINSYQNFCSIIHFSSLTRAFFFFICFYNKKKQNCSNE